MLAKEIFSHFYLFFLIRQMASGRLRTVPGFWSSALGPECPCSCCCCHSSIFVSLCSACLKDCNIYLDSFFFLPLTESFACCKGNAFPLAHAHRHALQCTETLRPRILTSVFAAFYVIHGHSPYACAFKFTARQKINNLYARIWAETSLPENHVIYAIFHTVATEMMQLKQKSWKKNDYPF